MGVEKRIHDEFELIYLQDSKRNMDTERSTANGNQEAP
jgi:hypothetical protein